MSERPQSLARAIRKEAARLGFAAIGFSSPVPQPLAMKRYKNMIQEGRHGEMGYMETRMEERADPSLLLPGLKTIISATLSYNQAVEYQPGAPKISKYALIDDYHRVLREKLEQLVEVLNTILGEPLTTLIAVDSSPLLEKSWAEKAGLGKSGKNTLLMVPSAGTYLFLGEILLDREIREERHLPHNHCGSCSLCVECCPTGALVDGGKLDATRCISYLTVELKREFTAEEAGMIGEWLFGCDLCQEACPYNQQALVTADASFALRQNLRNITTDTILNLTKSGFRELFYGTPIFRIGLRRLKRNARAVAENLKKRAEP